MNEIVFKKTVGEYCNKPYCQFLESANEVCLIFNSYLAKVKATGNIIRCDKCKEAEIKENHEND